ncbi:MAG TPA: S9 family peptidase [Gemmatimonadales bacterium]|nr:S9 family peptidase [Gemmatimonadales bacterium]
MPFARPLIRPAVLAVALALIGLPSGPGPVAAQQSSGPRALIAEDYYRLKSVGAPRISPDGRWVVYTVSQPVETTNTGTTETWLAAADGATPPVQVTHEAGEVTAPRWGDDNRLQFTVQNATWIWNPSSPGVAAVREPESALGPAGLVSPDGRWVARLQPTPVTPPSSPALSDFAQRHEDRFKGDAFDWYPFRQDGQRFPLPDRASRPVTEVAIAPADGGEPRVLTSLGLPGITALQWVPDGSALQFGLNATAARVEGAYGATELYRVTLDGQTTRLTEDGWNETNASFSPDGRWMSFTRSFSTQRIVDQKLEHGGSQDLYLQPAGGGTARNLTAEWDLDPGSPRWSPDSRSLYFTAQIGGAIHLFRVAAAGGPVEQVTRGERRINGWDVDRAFRRITYTVGEFDRPPEVYVADIDGGNERRLSDVHREFLADVEIATRATETVQWRSTDGTTVEGFLRFPHGYNPAGGPYPLIVMNHGGPHAASGYGLSFKEALFAAHGYFVFLPNFRSSTGYGDAFKWGTWGGWGNRDGEDVISGIDFLAERHAIDLGRVGTTGHSYGGILTNWLITRYPDRFRAAIPGAGESNWTANYALSDVARTKDMEFFGPPWEPRALEVMIAQSPYFRCANTTAATLFIHGAVDYRVPLEGAIQLYTCLKKIGTPAKLIIYEGQAHGISGHWNNVHRMLNELRWWETYLK